MTSATAAVLTVERRISLLPVSLTLLVLSLDSLLPYASTLKEINGLKLADIAMNNFDYMWMLFVCKAIALRIDVGKW